MSEMCRDQHLVVRVGVDRITLRKIDIISIETEKLRRHKRQIKLFLPVDGKEGYTTRDGKNSFGRLEINSDEKFIKFSAGRTTERYCTLTFPVIGGLYVNVSNTRTKF